MLNLLANAIGNPITPFPADFGNSLNWLGTAIQWVVGLVSIVGVGIILFTLVLKLITLPLDIYSKAKMRKNNLKMEKMRPQLEKLQKQYQNDQRAYNQKMMELYKKNGYSMFGACLPMIVTLVIFMVVLGAFSTYSQYTNVDLYRRMTLAYNAAIQEYAPEGYNAETKVPSSDPVITEEQNDAGQWVYTYTVAYDDDAETTLLQVEETRTLVSDTKLDTASIDWNGANVSLATYYYCKTDKILASGDLVVTSEDGADVTVQQLLDRFSENYSDDDAAEQVMRQIGRNAAEDAYHEHRMSFLWVKNIWLPDTSYTHPVQKEPEVPQGTYDEITSNLADEQSAPNGYYILIVISIGTMFLSQFILAKSQKAQNDLQTANGQGAKTQKVMMIVMPIIFGIFSFMYSAAFSIYMVVSNIFGIVSTLLINFFIDRKFKKIEEQEIQEKYNKRIPQANRAGEGKSGGKKK